MEGSMVRCELACGFGTSPGTYRFRLSAPGYVPERLTVTADYQEFHGGCPSWNDGGTRHTASLSPL